MAANIVQAGNRPLVAARNDEGIRVHLQREVISGLRDFARLSGEKPARAPDAGQIVAVNLCIGIELARKRPARPATRNERFEGNLHAHGIEEV